MTTPNPTPAPAPAPAPAPVAPASGGNPVTNMVHWLEQHVVPSLKAVDGYAVDIVAEATKIEAVITSIDPAIGAQLESSVAILRDIAQALAAL